VLFDFCSDCAGFRDLEARILFTSFYLLEVFNLPALIAYYEIPQQAAAPFEPIF
jgi:hypothetical protein